MLRTTITLTALAVCAAPLTAQDTVQEPSSKVPFPVKLETALSGPAQSLMGMGVRTKTILKVKVYAFGLYVDEQAAREVMSDFTGLTHKELEKNDAFFARILDMEFPMTLRLVMTRDVDGETMADAFEESLLPRVERAATEKNMPGGVEALEQFRQFFSIDKVTKESELVFTCADGTMGTSIRGEVQPEVQNAALCWALFDVYLGQKPISGGGKKKVIAGFEELLSGEAN